MSIFVSWVLTRSSIGLSCGRQVLRGNPLISVQRWLKLVLELARGIDGLVGAGGAIADVCQMLTVVCLVRHMVAGAAMGCHCLATIDI